MWDSSNQNRCTKIYLENTWVGGFKKNNNETNKQCTHHQLMKDLGVISRLDAKSSLNRRWVIKATNVFSDSSNLVFVIVSGQSLGWNAQPEMRNRDKSFGYKKLMHMAKVSIKQASNYLKLIFFSPSKFASAETIIQVQRKLLTLSLIYQ